jgi:hypothetical protein
MLNPEGIPVASGNPSRPIAKLKELYNACYSSCGKIWVIQFVF